MFDVNGVPACGGDKAERFEFYCINDCDLCAANPINKGEYKKGNKKP